MPSDFRQSIVALLRDLVDHALAAAFLVAFSVSALVAVVYSIVVDNGQAPNSTEWIIALMGFSGAGFGAGAAIWWARRERNRSEMRKRQAIGVALYYELSANYFVARDLASVSSSTQSLQSASLDAFYHHVEYFEPSIIYYVQRYGEQLATVQRLLDQGAPFRSFTDHDRFREEAKRLYQRASYAKMKLARVLNLEIPVNEGRGTVSFGFGVSGRGHVGAPVVTESNADTDTGAVDNQPH